MDRVAYLHNNFDIMLFPARFLFFINNCLIYWFTYYLILFLHIMIKNVLKTLYLLSRKELWFCSIPLHEVRGWLWMWYYVSWIAPSTRISKWSRFIFSSSCFTVSWILLYFFTSSKWTEIIHNFSFKNTCNLHKKSTQRIQIFTNCWLITFSCYLFHLFFIYYIDTDN